MRRNGSRETRYGRLGVAVVVIAATLAAAGIPARAGEPDTKGCTLKAEKSRTGESGTRRCTAKLEVCVEYMTRKMKSSGWVGVELEIDEETGIFKVEQVLTGSPAEKAGIRPGDILKAVNGMPVSDFREKMLAGEKGSWAPGQSITYTIRRDGASREIRIVLAAMPAEVLARYIGRHMLEHVDEEKPND